MEFAGWSTGDEKISGSRNVGGESSLGQRGQIPREAAGIRERQGREILQEFGLFLADRRNPAFESNKQSSQREGRVWCLCSWWGGLEADTAGKIWAGHQANIPEWNE